MKTTATYWNPLAQINHDKWEEIQGSNGNLLQLTLAFDEKSGDYTRLTKFKDGYCTMLYGAKSHAYPEEIFVIQGRLFDETFGVWLETGYYASRPPYEVHGPFMADGDVIILEMSYPGQSIKI